MTTKPNPVAGLIEEWQAARAALAEIERAEHSDIADEYGRTWSWWKGDLYRHDQFAFPEDMVRAGIGRPSKVLLDNPNYRLCDICKEIIR